MNRTNIEYLTHSWNPIAMRCTPVSSGCKNCWHLRLADMLSRNPLIDGSVWAAYAGGIPILLNDKELYVPIHLRKPARIGVQFMGDLFCEDVPFDFVKPVFQSAANSKCHTYLFLTKRQDRMLEFVRWFKDHAYRGEEGYIPLSRLPDNWWLGVSVEDQKTADERIPILLQIPATHRWVSYEPALGPVDFSEWFGLYEYDEGKYALKVGSRWKSSPDWIVCGPETGPGARPMDIEWARNVVNQCQAAGVPVFVKALTINGKVSKDMSEWPADLRKREIP